MSEPSPGAEPPFWAALLPPRTRPGSRTVICDPPDDELILELARRGYRLLVLHDGGFAIDALRQRLRELGLSSQLMGSQVYPEEQLPRLAREIYELWIFCAAPHLLPVALKVLLPGSTVYWPGQFSLALSEGTQLLEGLPSHLTGLRLA